MNTTQRDSMQTLSTFVDILTATPLKNMSEDVKKRHRWF